MGDMMPFIMAKGPVWEYFDYVYTPQGPLGTAENRLALLNRLRRPAFDAAPVDDDEYWRRLFIEAYTHNRAPIDSIIVEPLLSHIVDDWFTGRAPAGSEHGWMDWTTNPAEVIARGLARAIEVSLGLLPHYELPDRRHHLSPPPAAHVSEVSRCWPIEFQWVCAVPVMQCWIHWRPVTVDGDSVHGLVTHTYATPAPAWGQLAFQPAGQGDYEVVTTDPHAGETTVTVQPGPLGLVDQADGQVLELFHKNALPRGTVMVGHSDTVVAMTNDRGSDASDPHDLDDDDGDEAELGGLQLRLQLLAERGLAQATNPDANRSVFVFQVKEGIGPVVTVSPFTGVGGHAEPRPRKVS